MAGTVHSLVIFLRDFLVIRCTRFVWSLTLTGGQFLHAPLMFLGVLFFVMNDQRETASYKPSDKLEINISRSLSPEKLGLTKLLRQI